MPHARVMAGIPALNKSLYHRIRFAVGDPAALIELPGDDASTRRILIIRDIEMQRARQHARADAVACPRDYEPASGLSGDRETATAQALAECLRREHVDEVVADRTFPLIFAHELRKAGITVDYDAAMGVLDRRSKDADELNALRAAQRTTEEAMRMACELVARADVGDNGLLLHEGQPLTSERLRAAIDIWFLERNYANEHASIVAGGPQGADCHERGSGPLRTGQPVIIDIFPCDRATLYNGDCTRTVVHGRIPETIAKMHRAVVEAKAAAIAATRPGVTGQAVHEAAIAVIRRHGFGVGLDEQAQGKIAMVHGTGHGIGLDVHEPPLLDFKGPELIVGDVLTIEPGLYGTEVGGLRVEDMVAVTADGCENFNTLHEGLDWA